MNRLKIIAVLLLAALLPTACGNLNDNKKISIAYANWSEGIAMSYLIKVILEEHGYDVRMLNADLAPIFASLSRKKADVFMDVWLPVTMHDKGVFTDEEKDKLAETGTLGGIKEMKDTLTGNVCKCYVSFHESTNRIITMPVDAIKIPDYIYGKRLDDKQKQILASGGEVPINDIQRKNDTMLSGVAYVDPTIRDIAFKQSDKQLKVNDTILGAKITPEQKKILENHGMVFIENMRNPKTRQLFSDDVRFSNKSNNLLIGRNAREYKPAVETPKNNRKQETKQTARHVVSPRPQARKNSLSFS